MKKYLLALLILTVGCGENEHSSNKSSAPNFPKKPRIPKNITQMAEGAVNGDFMGNKHKFYGFVKNVDLQNEITSIYFEDGKLPPIDIPESIGAELHALKFKNWDRDLLLVNAKLRDTNFNEYYLFMLRDSLWKQVVNRFDIHKSNMHDTLVPVQVNPKDSTELFRYYSVFDMDRNSSTKFSWMLQRESLKIEETP